MKKIVHVWAHNSTKMPAGAFEETGRYWRNEIDDVVAECRHVDSGQLVYLTLGLRDFYPTLAGAKRSARLRMPTISSSKRYWVETTERGRCRDPR